jgi:hypothetical protein
VVIVGVVIGGSLAEHCPPRAMHIFGEVIEVQAQAIERQLLGLFEQLPANRGRLKHDAPSTIAIRSSALAKPSRSASRRNRAPAFKRPQRESTSCQ